MAMSDAAMPLKAFFEAVEARLSKFSAAEMRSILLGMARVVVPKDRRAFLTSLEPGEEKADVLKCALRQDDLLSEIDDLAAELDDATGEGGDYDYGEQWDDEDSLGPYERFLAPLGELFDRAGGAADGGAWPLAREAYRRLFDALGLEDDYGRGVRSTDLVDVDGRGAVGRYLRAVYETEAAADRPERLFEAIRRFEGFDWPGRIMLEDLIRAADRPLPDREPFLRTWIDFLRKQEGPAADRWLREAVRLLEGVKGLETLAREEGKARPRAYLDWLDALKAGGKAARPKVVAGARKALRELPADQSIRAEVADRLCEAAQATGDSETVREGRWEAFLAQPGLGRLLDLWEATPETGRKARMRQAVRRLERVLKRPTRRSDEAFGPLEDDDLDDPGWVDSSLVAHALMLGGDWEAARKLAADAPVLEWIVPGNPQSLVAPACLVLVSGNADDLPPNLTRVWDGALETATSYSSYEKPSADRQRLASAYQSVMTKTRLKKAEAESLLAWCVENGERRAIAIVEKLRRASYDQAAEIVAASAEVLRLHDRKDSADELLERIRERFPRHRAFQDELAKARSRIGRGS